MADVDGKVRDWIADVTGGEVGDVVALPSGGRAGYFVDDNLPAFVTDLIADPEAWTRREV